MGRLPGAVGRRVTDGERAWRAQLLAAAVDREGADLVLHGHAHAGTHEGRTPGGIPVRNAALPVLRRAYQVFDLAGVALGEQR